MHKPVVIDVETQLTFREAGGFNPAKLKISVAGIYDYASENYFCFEEKELSKLFPYLENASQVIGFNIVDFDLPALSPYYVGQLSKLSTLDILKHVEKNLGFRISLDDLIRETLQVKKAGHGLLAIEYFRAGYMEKLKKYCLSDVEYTRNLYEYGKTHGKVFFNTAYGRREIPVSWAETKTQTQDVNLTLPW